MISYVDKMKTWIRSKKMCEYVNKSTYIQPKHIVSVLVNDNKIQMWVVDTLI